MIEKPIALRLDHGLRLEINRILSNGKPSALRSHQLVKILKMESSSSKDWRQLLADYYEIPYSDRKPPLFRLHFGIKVYPWLWDQFLLKLQHIKVSETEIHKAALNFYHLAQELLPVPKGIFTKGISQAVIYRLVHPRYDRSFFAPNLVDFVEVWAEVIYSKFGALYEGYFSALLEDLHKYSLRLEMDLSHVDESPLMGKDPTETELQWLLSVVKSVCRGRIAPGFPLRSGPRHPKVKKINELVRLAKTEDIHELLTESVILLHRYKKIEVPNQRTEAA